MSSQVVRETIAAFLGTNVPGEKLISLEAEFPELRDLLAQAGLSPDAPWLGINFVGDDEIPVSLAATNEQGLYRETGSILLHVCAEAKIGVQNSMISRAEVLRNLFRGRRIDSIVIEGVSPVNFLRGATLEFDGGYVSGTITIAYHRDLSPTP